MRFLLFTRKNPLVYNAYDPKDISHLKEFNFDENKPLKILIHGWMDSWKSNSLKLKNALLEKYDANIVMIDWKEEAGHYWYPFVKAKVPNMGLRVAHMLDEFVEKLGVDPDNIHSIGHSLGAHIAGIAGLKTSVSQIARITGLDPARPLFSMEDELRIRKQSAKFVDIIHTDGVLGMLRELGHVDFFPNGGISPQPGCGLDITRLRSHVHSIQYYTESVLNPGAFLAVSCPDWESFKRNKISSDSLTTEMGEHVSLEARGKFYLVTNGKSPFGLGARGLRYKPWYKDLKE